MTTPRLRRDDGLAFYRGLLVGLLLSAPFWLCIAILIALP